MYAREQRPSSNITTEYCNMAILALPFSTVNKFKTQYIEYNIIVNNTTNTPYIIEVSYGLSNLLIMGIEGSYTSDDILLNKPLPLEIFK